MDENRPFRTRSADSIPTGPEQPAIGANPSPLSGSNAPVEAPIWESFVTNTVAKKFNREAVAEEQQRVNDAEKMAKEQPPLFKGVNGKLIRRNGRQTDVLDPAEYVNDPLAGAEARRSLWDKEIQDNKRAASNARFLLQNPQMKGSGLSDKDRADIEAQLHGLAVTVGPDYENNDEYKSIKGKLIADDEYRATKSKLEQDAWDQEARARVLETMDPEEWWNSRPDVTQARQEQRQATVADAQQTRQQAEAAEAARAKREAELRAKLAEGVRGDESQAIQAELQQITKARQDIAAIHGETAQQVEQVRQEAEAQIKKPEKEFFRVDDAISGIWDAVKGLGVTAPAAFYQLVEGLDRPDQYSDSAKAAFAEADAFNKEMQAKTEANQKAGTSSSVGESFREAGGSLGFSLGSMAAAIPASVAGGKVGALTGGAIGAAFAGGGAVPGAAIGGTVGGVAAGMAASGTAAYRMAGASFLNEAFQTIEAESIRKNGRPMNEAEKASAYEALLPIAKNTALWEAGPEAVGNAVTMGAGKIIFNLGKPLAAKFATSLGGKIAVKAGAGAGALAGELTTETLTQVEQGADQKKMEAVVAGEDPNAIQADWSAGGVVEAFKEIAPQTLAMIALMGGAGGVVKAGAMGVEKLRGKGPEAGSTPDMGMVGPPPVPQVNEGLASIDPEAPPASPEEVTGAGFMARPTDGPKEYGELVLATRELAQAGEQHATNLQSLREQLAAAQASGDKGAVAVQEAALAEAEAAPEPAALGTAVLKIAAGQDFDKLTPEELAAIGYKEDGTTEGADGSKLKHFAKIEAEKGKPEPPQMVTFGADDSIILTDTALNTVGKISKTTRARVAMTATEAMAKAEQRAEARRQASAAESAATGRDGSSEGAATPASPTGSAVEYDVRLENGATIRVSATSPQAAEAEAAAQSELGVRVVPGSAVAVSVASPVSSVPTPENGQTPSVASPESGQPSPSESDLPGFPKGVTRGKTVIEVLDGPNKGRHTVSGMSTKGTVSIIGKSGFSEEVEPGNWKISGDQKSPANNNPNAPSAKPIGGTIKEGEPGAKAKQAAETRIATIGKRSPRLADAIKETGDPSIWAQMSLDGQTIFINTERIIKTALDRGMTEAQAARYFANVLDEEIRHMAHNDAAIAQWEQSGSDLDFEEWREQHYGEIWQTEFEATGKAKDVRALYSQNIATDNTANFDTLPDWQKAFEAIRMMSQKGRITETSKLWTNIGKKLRKALEAALVALRAFSEIPSETLRTEIKNLENALRSLTEASPPTDSGTRGQKPAANVPPGGNRQPAEGQRDSGAASDGQAEQAQRTIPVSATLVGSKVGFTRNGERLTGTVTWERGDAVRIKLDAPDGEGVPTRTARRDELEILKSPEWVAFAEDSGTLGIPRSEMPQIKAEDRSALVQFLKARGIDYQEEEVRAGDLKPTQAEFAPKKVQKAREFTGGDRAILISSDGHVIDGHHQWLAQESDELIRVIRLLAPVAEILDVIHDMPSVEKDENTATISKPDEATGIDPRIVLENGNATARPDNMALIRQEAGLDTSLAPYEMTPEQLRAYLQAGERLGVGNLSSGYVRSWKHELKGARLKVWNEWESRAEEKGGDQNAEQTPPISDGIPEPENVEVRKLNPKISKSDQILWEAGWRYVAVLSGNKGGFLSVDGYGETEAQASVSARRQWDEKHKARAKAAAEVSNDTAQEPTLSQSDIAQGFQLVRPGDKPEIAGLPTKAVTSWTVISPGGERTGQGDTAQKALAAHEQWKLESDESAPEAKPAKKPKKQAATESTPAPQEIGRNLNGDQIFEDSNGVRYLEDSGFKISQPVEVRPTRSGVESVPATPFEMFKRGNRRFLTEQELEQFSAEQKAPSVAPSAPKLTAAEEQAKKDLFDAFDGLVDGLGASPLPETSTPLTEQEQSRYAHQRCHEFTAAVLTHRKAGEAFVAETKDGEIPHSAARLPNSETFVDAETIYDTRATFESAMERKYDADSIRPATIAEIERMIPGDNAQRAIDRAKKPSLRVIHAAEQMALQASELPETENFRERPPADRLPAFQKAAQSLISAGVESPANLAAFLEKIAPGKLRPYSEFLWRQVNSFLMGDDVKSNWPTIYGDLDNVQVAAEIESNPEDDEQAQRRGNGATPDGTRPEEPTPDGTGGNTVSGSGEGLGTEAEGANDPAPKAPSGRRGRGRRGNPQGSDRDAGSEGDQQDAPESDSGSNGLVRGTNARHKPRVVKRAEPGTPEANFAIGDDFSLPATEKSRIEANLEAIALLRKLETEERNATAEEKKVLSKYSGWGSFKEAFNTIKQAKWDRLQEQIESSSSWQRENIMRSEEYVELEGWRRSHGALHDRLKGILDEAEFRSMSKSVMNAHYTNLPVIDGMWKLVERLGFKGGNVLENSAGGGYFIGRQPSHLAAESNWSAVELDEITARILSKLYPEIRVNGTAPSESRVVSGQGFQESKIPNNSIDLVIGNFPFHRKGPGQSEQEFGMDLNLHNYFFARSISKLKPGGLIVAITSASTMDNNLVQRELLAGRAELIGAIRLPNTAFKGSAGTEVTTDIVILRKKDGNLSEHGKKWLNTIEVGTDTVTWKPSSEHRTLYDWLKAVPPEWKPVDTELAEAWEKWDGQRPASGKRWNELEEAVTTLLRSRGLAQRSNMRLEFTAPIIVNQYFEQHPEMALGKHALSGSMYSANEYTLASDGRDLGPAIEAIAEMLPADVLGTQTDLSKLTKLEAETGDRDGSTVERDGAIYQVVKGELIPVRWDVEFMEDEIVKTGIFKGKTEQRKVFDRIRDGLDPDATMEHIKALMDKHLSADERKKLEAKLEKELARRLEVFRSWAAIRDATLDLVNAERGLTNASDAKIEDLRKKLNEAYDSHVKKYGPLTKRRSNRLKFLDDDQDAPLVDSLEDEEVEKLDEKGNPVYRYVKRPIFTRRILESVAAPTSAENIEEAVGISLGFVGKIDLPYMASLLSVSEADIADMLTEKELAFIDPISGQYELADLYLSGEVRTKLQQAKKADFESPGEYEANIKALEKVLPARRPARSISIVTGARWIRDEIYTQFAADVLGQAYRVKYVKEANLFRIEADPTIQTRDVGEEGALLETRYKSRIDILDAALNMRRLVVRNRDGDVIAEATEEANTKVDAMKERFNEWVKGGDSVIEVDGVEMPVREVAENDYNDKVAGVVPPNFKGDWITLPGQSGEIYVKNRPHRRAVLARLLLTGYGMMAHGVGSGKTYNQIALAMEMRRLGKARKPMILVQNSTIKQFAASFMKAYPTAKILVADSDNFSSRKRARFQARVATGDYDAIILTHSNVSLINHSQQSIRDYMARAMDQLDAALEQAEDKSQEQRDIQTARDNLQERLNKMLESATKRASSILTWEQLGVDALIVDEAHEFKNTPVVTRMSRVKNLPTGAGADRAIMMQMKVASVQANNDGKNVFFATGTPITNTMAEAYTMLKYVAPKVLENRGINNFDDFATMFGRTVSEVESTWKGEIEMVERFAKFVNGPELINLVRSVFDVALGNDELGLRVPRMRGGKPQAKFVEPTEANEIFNDWVIDTAAEFASIPNKKQTFEENPWMGAIPIMTMQAGMAQAIDPRLINPDVPDDPKSKVNQLVDEIVKIYERGKDRKTAQVVFSDLQNPFSTMLLRRFNGDPFEEYTKETPRVQRMRQLEGQIEALGRMDDNTDAATKALMKAYMKEYGELVQDGFNLFDDIKKKLVARNIPENEIFIASSDVDRDKLQPAFDKVNDGRIRIIMGSTARLGVGVNIQERLAAAHNLSPPRDFKPAMMEQRLGRLIRQGNLFRDWADEAFVKAVEELGRVKFSDGKTEDRFEEAQEWLKENDRIDPATGEKISDLAEAAAEEFAVDAINYGLKFSMDSAVYSMMGAKQGFIEQLLMGENVMDEFDDPAAEEIAGFMMFAAETMGNEDMKKKVSLETELRKLTAQRTAHNNDTWRLEDNIRMNKSDLKRYEAIDLDKGREISAKFEGVFERVKRTVRTTKGALAKQEGNEWSGKELSPEEAKEPATREDDAPVYRFGDVELDMAKPSTKIADPVNAFVKDLTKAAIADLDEVQKKPFFVNGVQFTVAARARQYNSGDVVVNYVVAFPEEAKGVPSFKESFNGDGDSGGLAMMQALRKLTKAGNMETFASHTGWYSEMLKKRIREDEKALAERTAFPKEQEWRDMVSDLRDVNRNLRRAKENPRNHRYYRSLSRLIGKENAELALGIDQKAGFPEDVDFETWKRLALRMRVSRHGMTMTGFHDAHHLVEMMHDQLWSDVQAARNETSDEFGELPPEVVQAQEEPDALTMIRKGSKGAPRLVELRRQLAGLQKALDRVDPRGNEAEQDADELFTVEPDTFAAPVNTDLRDRLKTRIAKTRAKISYLEGLGVKAAGDMTIPAGMTRMRSGALKASPLPDLFSTESPEWKSMSKDERVAAIRSKKETARQYLDAIKSLLNENLGKADLKDVPEISSNPAELIREIRQLVEFTFKGMPTSKGIGASPLPGPSDFVPFPAEWNSLNVPRSEMPQVTTDKRPAFLQFLKDAGVKVTDEQIKPDSITPIQIEYSPSMSERAKTIPAERRVFVSADNYLLDGHHQWMAQRDRAAVNVTRIDLPVREAIATMFLFPGTEKREGMKFSRDPRLVAEFGENYEADEYGMPVIPATLPDGHDLLIPTHEKSEVEIPTDHPLVVGLPADHGLAKGLPEDHPARKGGFLSPGKMSRRAMRRGIVNFFMSYGAPVEEGTAPIVFATGGGSGAGKSTILRILTGDNSIDTRGAIPVNSDDIKELIPEYHSIVAAGDGRAAAIVHEESSKTMEDLLGRIVTSEQRFNFVFDGTLANTEKSLRKFESWKKAGYEIALIAVTIDPREAIIRAVIRGKSSGRWVPTKFMAEAHAGFNRGVMRLAEAADAAYLYDNTPPEPHEIAKKAKSEQISIVNRSYFDKIPLREKEISPLREVQTPPNQRSGNPRGSRAEQEGRLGEPENGPESQGLNASPLPEEAPAGDVFRRTVKMNPALVEEAKEERRIFGQNVSSGKLAGFGSEQTRAELDAIDAVYEFTREIQRNADQMRIARQMVEADPADIDRKALDAITNKTYNLTPADHLAIQLRIDQRIAEANGDPAKLGEAGAMAMAYRMMRGDAGRLLQIGYDRMLTPAERHLAAITDAIFTPTKKIGKVIASKPIAEREAFIREAAEARVKKVEAELSKLGLDIATITRKSEKLALANSSLMKEVKKLRKTLDQNILTMIQNGADKLAIRRRYGAEAADKAQEIANQARQELAAKIQPMVAAGMTMEEIIAKVGKISASPLPGAAGSPLTPEAIAAEVNRILTLGFGIPEVVPEKNKVQRLRKPKPAVTPLVITVPTPTKFDWNRPDFKEGLKSYEFKNEDLAGIKSRVETLRILAGAVGKIEKLEGAAKSKAEALLAEIETILGKYGTNVTDILTSDKHVEDYRFDITDINHVATVARMISTMDADWIDKTSEVLYANMLSGLQTMLVNATAVIPGGWEATVGRGMDLIVNQFVRDPMSAQFGEMKYLARAFGPALSRAQSNFMASLQTQLPMADRDLLNMQPDMERIMGGKGYRIGGAIKGKLGDFIRIPMRLLMATDDFNVTLFGAGAVGAYAYRIAKAKGLKPGSAEFDREIRKQVNMPGSEAYILAFVKAKNSIFANPLPGETDTVTGKAVPVQGIGDMVGYAAGKLTTALSKEHDSDFIKAFQMLLKISFFPFQRVPFNILRKGVRYTLNPVSMFDIALGFIQNSRTVDKAGNTVWRWNAGGRNPELVERMGQQLQGGILLAILLASAAGEGDDEDQDKRLLITGSSPFTPKGMAERTAQMRAGIGPYRISIRNEDGTERVGFNYGRIEPMSTTLGTTIDTIKAFKRAARSGKETSEAAAEVVGGLVAQAQDKTFLRGVGDLVGLLTNAISEPDLKQNRKFQQFIAGRIAMAFPNLIKQPMREADSLYRERSNSFTEELSYQLFPYGQKSAKVDPYGNPETKTGIAAVRVFDMTDSGKNKVHPVDRMLLKWRDSGHWSKAQEAGDRKPWFPSAIYAADFENPRTKQRQKMTESQLDDFRKEAGRITGLMLAKERLNYEKPSFQDIETVKKIVSEARRRAKLSLAYKFARESQ